MTIFFSHATIIGARFPYQFHMTGFAHNAGEAERVALWCAEQIGPRGVLWEITSLGDFCLATEAHACAFKMMWL